MLLFRRRLHGGRDLPPSSRGPSPCPTQMVLRHLRSLPSRPSRRMSAPKRTATVEPLGQSCARTPATVDQKSSSAILGAPLGTTDFDVAIVRDVGRLGFTAVEGTEADGEGGGA